MFALHETTRKRICRTAFFALCLAPTLAMAGWVCRANRPWRDQDEAAELSLQLQSRVTLSEWETPKPGSFRFAEGAIVDAATEATFLELGAVERRTRGGIATIVASTATLDLSATGQAVAGKLDAWLAEFNGGPLDIRIDAVRMRLPPAGGAVPTELVLGQTAIRVEKMNDGAVSARFTAVISSGGAAKPMLTASVDRRIVDEHAQVKAALRCEQAPLPAALFALVWPGAERLGSHATFAGTMQFKVQNGALRGSAGGTIEHAELASLLPTGSPHRLLGPARITLGDARWADRRIEQLTGAIEASDVRVSRSLIASAVEKLNCSQVSPGLDDPHPNGETPEAGPLVAVDRLACRFEWNAAGLTILGGIDAPNGEQGDLATSGGARLLTSPQWAGFSVGHWMQFVAGPADHWLQATREAIDYSGRLPLPASKR